MVDGYYKCLLNMDPGRLQGIIDDVVRDKDQQFFMRALRDERVGESSDEELGNVLPERVALQTSVHDDVAVPIADSFFRRCIVDIGVLSTPLKVYFDNGTHQSGVPRGWAECERHGCKRYVFISPGQTRWAFCAEMYAWYCDHSLPSVIDKSTHLSHLPNDDRVAFVSDNLRIDEF